MCAVINTDFKKFDSLLHGFQQSSLYFMSGRPNSCRRSLIFNMALNIAQNSHENVHIICLDVSKKYVEDQLIRISGLTKKELKRLPIYVCDTLSSISDIKLHMQSNVESGIVFISYLELIIGDVNESRNEEIKDIVNTLKNLSDSKKIPVVLTSVNLGKDKRPNLNDYPYEEIVNQIADGIIFIYRPKIYADTLKEDVIELIISKNQFGELGIDVVKVDYGHMRLTE